VARALGVHVNTVATWEQNQKAPFARQVVRVVDFLGYCPWSPGATFGKRLRRAREAQGLGQRELASLLGTSQEVLRSWEKGRCRPSKRFRTRLNEVLGLTV